MNLAQKVAFNTGIQLGGQFIVLAIGLLTLRLTATYLGVETFGQLSIVLSLTGLVAIIADLGVTTTLARELTKSPDEADRLGGDLLRFRLGSSVVCVLLLLAAIPLLPYTHETKLALLISLPAMMFTILGGFPGAFFQTHLRQELTAAVNVLTRSLGLGAILVVRVFDLGLYGLVGLLVAVNGIGCLVAFALSRRFWRINLSFNWTRAKPLIRDSVLIGLVSMIGLLHLRGDAIMLSLMKPADDVGIYAIAYRFIDQAFLLPGLFVATMFPIITRAVHQEPSKAERAINTTFQALVLGAIAVTLMIYVLSGRLVRLVAGAEFEASTTPLRILAFALLFMYVAPVFYNVLIVINKQKHLILIGAASVAVNVGLNLVLIPRHSYNGAASATVISEAFALVGLYLIARRHYDFRLEKTFLLRALGATAAAVGVVALLRSESPWLAFVLAELTFCAAAFAFKAVTSADMRMVLQRRTV